MQARRAVRGLGLSLGCAVVMMGCQGEHVAPDAAATEQRQTAALATTFDSPLPGLTGAQQALFSEGRDAFAEEEDAADGLGPVFNGNSCAACHIQGAVGGAGETVETRFGRRNPDGTFDPLDASGGSLIQTTGIGVQSAECAFAGEQVPASANVVAGRLTTPLFGLGLVDAVPDSTFIHLADTQRQYQPRTAGRVSMVNNPPVGTQTVGKFGWKAQVPSLLVFSADAYLNEMGITTSIFPRDNCPQGDCALLARCDPRPDAAGPEDANDTDMLKFRDFMQLHAAPPPGTVTGQTSHGEEMFDWIGCNDCHHASFTTGPNPIAALNKKTFFPYSDFLLHDMGPLGDGIVQGGTGANEMRTAPLWGARTRTRFLHDGRAHTVRDAILAHAGQGAGARDLFANYLFEDEREDLLAFINTL
ncbi:hypothetical protein JGU66_26820 [Myxococcaceae bacterium JPH2]|nr:hypothetical protein [Myxococcaceae bacterium JPH2]